MSTLSTLSRPTPIPSLPPARLPADRRAFFQHAAAGVAALGLMAARPAASQGLTGPAFEVTPWKPAALDFRLVDTSGKTWRPADFMGRAVLINFWASWCEPCRAEMPTLQQIADLYGPEKLLVLAVNFKERPSRALQFAATTGVTLPVLLDQDGAVARQWGVKVFPTTLMIDNAGRPRQRVSGEVDWTGSQADKLVGSLFKP